VMVLAFVEVLVVVCGGGFEFGSESETRTRSRASLFFVLVTKDKLFPSCFRLSNISSLPLSLSGGQAAVPCCFFFLFVWR